MLKKQKNGLNGYLIVPTTFTAKSLWYEPQEIIYTIDSITNELRWDFTWDPIFSNYDNRNIIFNNEGHIEAPFLLELDGEVVNPIITITDSTGTKELNLTGLTIEDDTKFIYNTKDTEQAIYILDNGSKTNLFEFLNPNFINFYKLEKGVSTISLVADTEITSGKLTIFVQYIAV